MRTSRIPAAAVAILLPLAVLTAGCGRSVRVSPSNRELLVSMATAISAREPNWLEQTERRIDQQRQGGQMDDNEYQVFRTILDQARSGDWPGAESAVYALRDSQEPTAEDRQNASNRQLGDHHGMAVPRPGKRR